MFHLDNVFIRVSRQLDSRYLKKEIKIIDEKIQNSLKKDGKKETRKKKIQRTKERNK